MVTVTGAPDGELTGSLARYAACRFRRCERHYRGEVPVRHLVVVIPGIGGSVLADGARVVWDAGIGDIAGLVLRPDRLDLGSAPKLTPKGLIRSRTWLPGWTVVHGYQGLMASLVGLPGAVVDSGDPGGRVPGATVVAFPYDFRHSIADAAGRLQAEANRRLEDLGGERDRRVIVVAHSMGGLEIG